MKQTLLFILLLAISAFPQLKELEVKPTTQKGAIPVNRDNPEKAAIFFYTQFDDLNFWSNYGIVDIKGDPEGGKYILIIEPVRQSIEIRRKGYKTEQIKINDIQPREVLFYEVLPKKGEYSSVNEIAITVQATPLDADVFLDSISFPNNKSTKIPVGKHLLRVEKSGYKTHNEEIEVSPDRTFFSVKLAVQQQIPVTFASSPSGTEIFLNDISYGQTPQSFFIYPGEYILKLIKSGYLPFEQKITVKDTTAEIEFNYQLTKSSGYLQIITSPVDASISINKQLIESGKVVEYPSGTYSVEVSREGYTSYKGIVAVEIGKTVIDTVVLTQMVGSLRFTVNPAAADCKLVRDGKTIQTWKGLKTLDNLPIGKYSIVAELDGYLKEERIVTIMEGRVTVEDIAMKLIKNIPQNLSEKQVVISGDQVVKILGMQQPKVDQLILDYDFQGTSDEEYDVELFLRHRAAQNFKESLENASGDIGGINFKPGRKRITVDLKGSHIEDHPELDYYFELEITKSGGLAWYYYVIGGVVAGGTAAVLILTSESKSETAPVTIGAPPVRP